MSQPRLRQIRIENYRSIRNLSLTAFPLQLIIGPNGVGKTNLYRALALLRSAALGNIARDIVEEGGVASAFWAGHRRRGEHPRIRLEANWEDMDYRIEIGLPAPTEAALDLEPLVKLEQIGIKTGGRRILILERKGPAITLRDEDGRLQIRDNQLLASQTALANLIDLERYPILAQVRQTLLDWRLYHGFRTDPDAPIRRPCPAVATPSLASDGHDLAAVFATVTDILGDRIDLDAAITDAFPQTQLLTVTEKGRCRFALQFPDIPRPFEAFELSDGTLRYLALAGALAGYRLPSFLVLNEPEASLHPDLLPALARLIARAADRTCIWVVTHSRELAAAMDAIGSARTVEIAKTQGQTSIRDCERPN